MMTSKEIVNAMNNEESIFSIKYYGNGDYIPFEGYISSIQFLGKEVENVTLKSMYGDYLIDIVPSMLYLKKNLPELKKAILLKEVTVLPQQIEILETDLKHKKRKLERYQKQLEEMEKQKDE